jgi:quinohemoprotein ethanol dehydrogenase
MSHLRTGGLARFACGVAIVLATAIGRAGAAATVTAVNWEYYGGADTNETHYSPLTQINRSTLDRLKLSAFADLSATSTASMPLAVDGVVYVAVGFSIVYAIEATTGQVLWRYDPEVARRAGMKLRFGWGIRGLAYAAGRLIVGTQDGRLLAVDAKTGKLAWAADTTPGQPWLYITGAPRVMGDLVVIGNGGADFALVRGYVSAYDVATGRLAWRFYTVPGDPSKGFESPAMALAAKTWSPGWWQYGGGGTAWSGMTYDSELHRVYIGVGNAAPWNWKIRNPARGDNLFLASIVALDARTGQYLWHYQVNPGEAWDYSAAMDMLLTTLQIGGHPRKVLLQAPKNGFFYVIDRESGKLISATPFVKTTWAKSIDVESGRPVESANIRYETGSSSMWPSFYGGHNWQPMAYLPQTGLIYFPTLNLGATWSDKGIDEKRWTPTPGAFNAAVIAQDTVGDEHPTGELLAWDPIRKRAAWRVQIPGSWGPGPVATAGGLVFSGDATAHLNAYDARDGQQLWSAFTGVAVTGPPITFSHEGRQFVAVLTGPPTSLEANFARRAGITWNFYEHPRRLLIYALDGRAQLPPTPPLRLVQPLAGSRGVATTLAADGKLLFLSHCVTCHGGDVISGGAAPDLRASPVPTSSAAFSRVVREGGLEAAGMPRFSELTSRDAEAIRAYIGQRAQEDLANGGPAIATAGQTGN